MFLPHEANPGRIEFSETTTVLVKVGIDKVADQLK